MNMYKYAILNLTDGFDYNLSIQRNLRNLNVPSDWSIYLSLLYMKTRKDAYTVLSAPVYEAGFSPVMLPCTSIVYVQDESAEDRGGLLASFIGVLERKCRIHLSILTILISITMAIPVITYLNI